MSRKNATTSATLAMPSLSPALDDALTRWHQMVSDALGVLSNVSARLTSPPGIGGRSDDLIMLLSIRKQLGVQGNLLNPTQTAVERWTDRVSGPHATANLVDALTETVNGIEAAIAAALNAGATSDELIRTADFKEVRTVDSGWRLPEAGHQAIFFAVGVLADLPTGHCLRTLLPERDCFFHSGRLASLVLGPMRQDGKPRPFYATTDAVALTRELREQQLQKIAEQEAERRREDERERLRFWESPLGVLQRQQEELARLRAADKIPPPPRPKRLG